MPKATSSRFKGFDKPDQNWFKLPKTWSAITRSITSIAELKVVEYVLQHTWANHEHGASKRISLNEFRLGIRTVDGKRVDDGTGLSKQSIITGLRKAVQRGLLIETVDARDRARVHKSYRLRMKGDVDTPDEQSVEPLSDDLDADVQVLDPVQVLDTGGQNSRHRSKNGNGNGSGTKRLSVTVNQLQTNPNGNREGDDSPLRKLPDNTIPDGQREHLVDVLLQRFRDIDNKAYYILVSRKIPEEHIWTNMAEVAQDPNIRLPERVFAPRIKKLANDRLKRDAVKTKRQEYETRRRDSAIGSL